MVRRASRPCAGSGRSDMRRALALTATLAALALVLGASIWLKQDNPESSALRMAVEPACDSAVQPCRARSADLTLELQLGPPVSPLRPFTAQLGVVDGELHAAAAVELSFVMRGMEMGLNRYRLQHAGEHWRGQVTLPVCTTGRVDWIAVVTVRSNGQQWIAEFPFATEPAG